MGEQIGLSTAGGPFLFEILDGDRELVMDKRLSQGLPGGCSPLSGSG